MEWDSIDQLRLNDELGTITIELITAIAALSVIIIIIYLKIHYPKLTRKGFNEMIIGFGVFAAHFIFDLLDTWVTKKINGETALAYSVFDMLDAIFAFIGLFIIGFAFYRIALYGIKIWEGK
ncbi:hypothetical protein DSAG12_00914 [Promethearchaeum syntrophicum]|uniref:Uncharacterized protein n=1 Tax=Promethearchaeum syntrophicum TaxID=2594042 RepID=A0A5B9D7T6_9ARCH|nr:hypothetical protein [Candidatus Prometheoarchaeum syntrophicum]QEE15091.1 hypothetical protein DSAG12_00914 [Candidatus Prometheoarchaeum syntrophicum]